MVHGNTVQYIRKNRVNRLELVFPSLKSDKQLHGAAQGLSYLRDCAGLTYGDLEEVSFLSSRDRFLIPFLTFNR